MAERPGLLVMAYGTPATPEAIEDYYTHVRRGRPPTPELLAELKGRYEAIGGVSPLLERTRAQARGIAAALGGGWTVELGMKHADPFIEEGVGRIVAAGVDMIVGLVLAPHYSSMSVGQYEDRARAATPSEMRFSMVRSWHVEPAYVELLSQRVAEALSRLGAGEAHVLFTAHSLPVRVLATGDPYESQLGETAAAVASALGLDADRWSIGWQSAGRTPEPWIGPDVLEVLPELARRGAPGVVVCACGFVSDHLEVLYDLDLEAARAASQLGLPFARTVMPNDDAGFCAMLADVVRGAALG